MARWYITEQVDFDEQERRNAFSKAREDAEQILLNKGFAPVRSSHVAHGGRSLPAKLLKHLRAYSAWSKALDHLGSGDVLVIQYPMFDHSILFSRVLQRLSARGVRIVLLLHDLEFFRLSLSDKSTPWSSWRVHREESKDLGAASCIIAHNSKMKHALKESLGINEERVVELGIFDYLSETPSVCTRDKSGPILVAGNLSSEKAGYLYDLPNDGEGYALYGVGYEPPNGSKAVWRGSFLPDELPQNLDGSFGLVWDGPSSATCTGAFGEYLKINNPHKVSLYLMSGMPVIIWDQAALAEFVLDKGVGIAVPSLESVPQAVQSMSNDQYRKMCDNVDAMAGDLARGGFLSEALDEALALVGPIDLSC